MIRCDDRDLTVVTCGGCDLHYLGNTGLENDPTEDISYLALEDGSKVFICSLCWASDKPRKYN